MLSRYSHYSSRMRSASLSLFAALMLITLLQGCSPADLLRGALGGGGINANAQVGQTNTQGVSVTREAPTVSVRPKGRVDTIDQSTTNNTELDPLLIALLIIGWLAPSPGEMWRGTLKLFKRKED